eukprot:9172479-Alexandrium_andersonii.AAC.1
MSTKAFVALSAIRDGGWKPERASERDCRRMLGAFGRARAGCIRGHMGLRAHNQVRGACT